MPLSPRLSLQDASEKRLQLTAIQRGPANVRFIAHDQAPFRTGTLPVPLRSSPSRALACPREPYLSIMDPHSLA